MEKLKKQIFDGVRLIRWIACFEMFLFNRATQSWNQHFSTNSPPFLHQVIHHFYYNMSRNKLDDLRDVVYEGFEFFRIAKDVGWVIGWQEGYAMPGKPFSSHFGYFYRPAGKAF